MPWNRRALLVALALAAMLPSAWSASFLEETRRKALAGDAQAQETLSYLYREGRGVEKDRDEARKWSAMAARSRTQAARPAAPPRPMPSSFSDDSVGPFSGPHSQPLLRSNGRSEPTRPTGYSSLQSGRSSASPTYANQSYRSLPTRPSATSYAGNRPAAPPRSYARYEDTRRSDQRIRSARKKRLGPVRLIWSPFGFALKHSKKAVSKIARRSAWEAARPY